MMLVVKREIRLGDEYRLEIIVDGKNHGKLARGEMVIELEDGEHEIYVKSFIWKSPVHKFVMDGSNVEVVCGLAKINKSVKSSALDPLFNPSKTYIVMDYDEFSNQ